MIVRLPTRNAIDTAVVQVDIPAEVYRQTVLSNLSLLQRSTQFQSNTQHTRNEHSNNCQPMSSKMALNSKLIMRLAHTTVLPGTTTRPIIASKLQLPQYRSLLVHASLNRGILGRIEDIRKTASSDASAAGFSTFSHLPSPVVGSGPDETFTRRVGDVPKPGEDNLGTTDEDEYGVRRCMGCDPKHCRCDTIADKVIGRVNITIAACCGAMGIVTVLAYTIVNVLEYMGRGTHATRPTLSVTSPEDDEKDDE
ncbi:hypothetical protein LTR56_023465 [Elasticomyces elasticus]|nr:hypothetical protein LTR56_023465 [Elasticomyces elasticus]KAK3625506.1 hypothetical protein LTR22_023520 [Elasticomyces elasticus]KAK5746317.1 hypothetical protein LTS12_022750 [Elasticomyces elasticus]